jgi:orotidine-5'-phosphate decarboxylase
MYLSLKRSIEMFIDRLMEKVQSLQNPTIMGLDPKIEYIPLSIREKNIEIYGNNLQAASASILEFNKKLIDAVAGIIPAIKPQIAYYEMYGAEGLKVFTETINFGREKGFLVVADAKRNDIGSTSEAYSAAFLGQTTLEYGKTEPVFNADALTVNGYLGTDGVKPILEDCRKYSKGAFILVKTSNPSSAQLQDLVLKDGRFVYEAMADLVIEWGRDFIGKCGYSSIGAVVGATWPEQLKSLRKRMPHTCFLVPGYGAQGGGAKDVAAAFNNGLGAVINASRSLMCAYKIDRWKGSFTADEFDLACRQEAIRMKKELQSVM